jgi:HEAT repeat protein
MAGHHGDEPSARAALADRDPSVRAVALGALARMAKLTDADLETGLIDASMAVRRRAAELALAHPGVDLHPALRDPEPLVAEMAAWALGERPNPHPTTVTALAEMATGHRDPLCREAAVAALGAVGDQGGLTAILTATTDKPAVRRRAVIALAAFDGPEVEAALQVALHDRDWQVRQAAEDLVGDG